jgi:hypothetical protein
LKNDNAFRVLAEKIEKLFLRKFCSSFYPNCQASFLFSTSFLQNISTATLVLSNSRVNVNTALFCYISDTFSKVFTSGTSLTSFEFSFPQELIEYFHPVLSLLESSKLTIIEEELLTFLQVAELISYSSL